MIHLAHRCMLGSGSTAEEVVGVEVMEVVGGADAEEEEMVVEEEAAGEHVEEYDNGYIVSDSSLTYDG